MTWPAPYASRGIQNAPNARISPGASVGPVHGSHVARLGMTVHAYSRKTASSPSFRRSFARRRDHVDVYFDDGSMVSFAEGSQEADTLLPVARDVLAAARR